MVREAAVQASQPVRLPGIGWVEPGDVMHATVNEAGWVQFHVEVTDAGDWSHSAWYTTDQLRGMGIRPEGTTT